ncbi:hypothetical protein V1292_001433 [Bradyrhizobium sp. AZCC 1719]
MAPMTMPEAAIDKDCDVVLAEYKIGGTRQRPHMNSEPEAHRMER